jgi:hypothetical protein
VQQQMKNLRIASASCPASIGSQFESVSERKERKLISQKYERAVS